MTSSLNPSTAILALRPATPDDTAAVARLAALDSAGVPEGDLLLGVVDGHPVAAISLGTGAVVADPFTPTADLVAMLRDRAGRIRAAAACEPRRRRAARPAVMARSLRRRAPGPSAT